MIIVNFQLEISLKAKRQSMKADLKYGSSPKRVGKNERLENR